MRKTAKMLLVAVLIISLCGTWSLMVCAEPVLPSDFKPLHFEGIETDIISSVVLPDWPCVVVYKQENPSEYEVGYVLNSKDLSLFREYDSTASTEVLIKAGEYEFFVETDQSWTLDIFLLPLGELTELSGNADCVSDIFTLEKSTVVQVTGKWHDFSNLIVHMYTYSNGYWDKDYLVSELESEGEEFSKKIVLKAGKPALAFLFVDTEHVDWTIIP